MWGGILTHGDLAACSQFCGSTLYKGFSQPCVVDLLQASRAAADMGNIHDIRAALQGASQSLEEPDAGVVAELGWALGLFGKAVSLEAGIASAMQGEHTTCNSELDQTFRAAAAAPPIGCGGSA